MKLTTKHGIYAKRILPLEVFMFTYLDALPEMTKEAVSIIAPNVRYFKSKHVYISRSTEKLIVETRHEERDACYVMLDTYLDNGVVCIEDHATLLFPAIEHVLYNEMILSKDPEAYKEKYSEFLK